MAAIASPMLARLAATRNRVVRAFLLLVPGGLALGGVFLSSSVFLLPAMLAGAWGAAVGWRLGAVALSWLVLGAVVVRATRDLRIMRSERGVINLDLLVFATGAAFWFAFAPLLAFSVIG